MSDLTIPDIYKSLYAVDQPNQIECQVGEVYYISDIEVLCIKEGQAIQQENNLFVYKNATARPMFIDRRHDLSFYFTESDFISSYAVSWGIKETINDKNFLYEGYPANTEYYSHTSEDLEAGPNNTEYILSLPEDVVGSNGYNIPTAHIKQFREKYGTNWFLGSWDSFRILTQGEALKTKLINADTSDYTESYRSSWYYYLSSSFSKNGYQMVCNLRKSDMLDNNHHQCRVRMSVVL